MGIKFKEVDGENDKMFLEVRLYCDGCDTRIESATNGDVSWTSYKPEAGFFYTHRHCFPVVEELTQEHGIFDQTLPLTRFSFHFDYGCGERDTYEEQD